MIDSEKFLHSALRDENKWLFTVSASLVYGGNSFKASEDFMSHVRQEMYDMRYSHMVSDFFITSFGPYVVLLFVYHHYFGSDYFEKEITERVVRARGCAIKSGSYDSCGFAVPPSAELVVAINERDLKFSRGTLALFVGIHDTQPLFDSFLIKPSPNLFHFQDNNLYVASVLPSCGFVLIRVGNVYPSLHHLTRFLYLNDSVMPVPFGTFATVSIPLVAALVFSLNEAGQFIDQEAYMDVFADCTWDPVRSRIHQAYVLRHRIPIFSNIAEPIGSKTTRKE